MQTASVPRASKADLIQDLICTSSHPLLLKPNGNRACARCPFVIPANSSVAQYTAYLEAACPGKRHIPEILLHRPVEISEVARAAEPEGDDVSLNLNLNLDDGDDVEADVRGDDDDVDPVPVLAADGEVLFEVPGQQQAPQPLHVPAADPAHFVFFGRLAAHYTHKMASSGSLRLHFCTRCGAWGQLRSVKLRDKCKPPTAAGQWALKRIHEGKSPITGR